LTDGNVQSDQHADGNSQSYDAASIDAGKDAASIDAGEDVEDEASTADGAYQCTITQVRSNGSSCDEPWPPGFAPGGDLNDGGGIGIGSTFAMRIAGTTVGAPGSFSCQGTWSGGAFECTINGTSSDGTMPCPGVQWSILTSGVTPNDNQPLQTGQIWAGIRLDNSFNAVCQR
jgi:hypothetical protein